MAEKLYRVWAYRNTSDKNVHYPVLNPEAGAKKINDLARKDLKNPLVESNAFGLEVFEDDEWSEWYDQNGDDIQTLADALWDEDFIV